MHLEITWTDRGSDGTSTIGNGLSKLRSPRGTRFEIPPISTWNLVSLTGRVTRHVRSLKFNQETHTPHDKAPLSSHETSEDLNSGLSARGSSWLRDVMHRPRDARPIMSDHGSSTPSCRTKAASLRSATMHTLPTSPPIAARSDEEQPT